MHSHLTEISPETAPTLTAQAALLKLSVEEYLRQLLGLAAKAEGQVTAPSPDDFTRALNDLAEDVPPLPRDFSREDIYLAE